MDDIKVSIIEFSNRKFYMMRYTDPLNGRKITKSTKVERTGRKTDRREAERVAAVWEADLQEGRYQSPSKMTWEAFRERYDAEVIPSFAVETISKVDTTFSLVEKILNPERLRELTTERVSQWVAALKENRADATVALYCRTLKSALNWAVDMGFLNEAPKFRFSSVKKMKGRPIVLEEFERVKMAVPKVVDPDLAPEWIRLLDGLWYSGFRLGEALALSWEPSADVSVIIQPGSRTAVRFGAAGQKGKRDELWPCPPEFARMLEAVPNEKRTGFVFDAHATKHPGRLKQQGVSRAIASFGKKAGVYVDDSHKQPCTAHDLRRSFGTRWSKKIMPVVLQRIMRHKSIDTTMKHYIASAADDIADVLYAAEQPDKSNTSGNTREESSVFSDKK